LWGRQRLAPGKGQAALLTYYRAIAASQAAGRSARAANPRPAIAELGLRFDLRRSRPEARDVFRSLLVLLCSLSTDYTDFGTVEKPRPCHPEPFTCCHAERSEAPSLPAQGKLREWSSNSRRINVTKILPLRSAQGFGQDCAQHDKKRLFRQSHFHIFPSLGSEPNPSEASGRRLRSLCLSPESGFRSPNLYKRTGSSLPRRCFSSAPEAARVIVPRTRDEVQRTKQWGRRKVKWRSPVIRHFPSALVLCPYRLVLLRGAF